MYMYICEQLCVYISVYLYIIYVAYIYIYKHVCVSMSVYIYIWHIAYVYVYMYACKQYMCICLCICMHLMSGLLYYHVEVSLGL